VLRLSKKANREKKRKRKRKKDGFENGQAEEHAERSRLPYN